MPPPPALPPQRFDPEPRAGEGWAVVPWAGRAPCPQDGFTHMSDDASLLLGIGNHFYKAKGGEWLLLVCDPVKLESEVRREPAAPVGDTGADFAGSEARLFPHLINLKYPKLNSPGHGKPVRRQRRLPLWAAGAHWRTSRCALSSAAQNVLSLQALESRGSPRRGPRPGPSHRPQTRGGEG